MTVECTEFIGLAQRLITLDESEITSRAAASRAYYGAFHCCRDLVEKHPEAIIRAGPSHEKVYQAVAALPATALGAGELKKIVYLTQQIRAIRNDADYEIKQPFPSKRARQAISEAGQVHNRHLKFCADYFTQTNGC